MRGGIYINYRPEQEEVALDIVIIAIHLRVINGKLGCIFVGSGAAARWMGASIADPQAANWRICDSFAVGYMVTKSELQRNPAFRDRFRSIMGYTYARSTKVGRGMAPRPARARRTNALGG